MNDEAISPREVLRTAANATGGEEKLAALLEIDLTELKAWLDGTRPPPFGTCIDALAISERHRQPSRQELRGVLSMGPAAGMAGGGSLERFARLA
jgi:hypothetical protein